MKTSLQKYIVPALVVLAFLLLCVRPAHSDGIVPSISQPYAGAFTSYYGPGSGSGNWSCGGQSVIDCLNAIITLSYTVTIVSAAPTAGGDFTFTYKDDVSGAVYSNGLAHYSGGWSSQLSCPSNATLTGSDCVCNAEYIAEGSVCNLKPPSACEGKIGTESPHLYADGVTAPSSACDQGCVVSIDIGASNGTIWVGWGQYTGADCTGQVAASPAPAPDPDVCPAGRTVYQGVCTPLVDIPELGYQGMSINEIQKAIAKSEAAAASKQKAVDSVAVPEYLSPESVPVAPSIQTEDAKKAVSDAGIGYRENARDMGGSGDTQIISEGLGTGFSSIVTAIQNAFGGNISAASVNGAQIDLVVQPTTKNIAVSSLSPVPVNHAQAVCPSTQITLQGHPATWTYTTECNFATGIRPILLTFAWLSAAFILVGGIKNG